VFYPARGCSLYFKTLSRFAFTRPSAPQPNKVDVPSDPDGGPQKSNESQDRNRKKNNHAGLLRIAKPAVRKRSTGSSCFAVDKSGSSSGSRPKSTQRCAILGHRRSVLEDSTGIFTVFTEGQLSILHTNAKLSQLPALAGAAKGRMYLWRRRAATAAAGALALVMAYGVVFGHNGLTAFTHKREEARALQLQMQRLQVENDRLREHVDHLQNDPGAIEHQAREELHYTRAGEVIYTLPPEPAPISSH
jgi:cell division protein FtsB